VAKRAGRPFPLWCDILRSSQGARARGIRAGIAAGIAAALVALACGLPLPPSLPCAFHALTGLPCLFCGGTRAADALLHGQWERALYLNPLAFPALLAALLVAGVLAIEAVRGRPLCDWERALRPAGGRLAAATAALCLAWWLPHVVLALKTPKPELVNLHNPVAGKLRSLFDRVGQD